MITKIQGIGQKIIVSILAILVMFPMVSHWQVVDKKNGNCELVHSSDVYANIPSDWTTKKFGNIFPIEAVNVAQNHLRSYCCKKGLLQDAETCKNLDTIYVESPFLFDHLLDIYLRRLDAFGKTDTTKDLMYWLEADPQWKERRDFMIEILQDPNGAPPMKIAEKYQKTWKLSTDPFRIIREWGGEDNTVIADTSLNTLNQDFNNWPLVNKYTYACELVSAMYFDLKGTFLINYDGESYSVYARWYLWCKNLIKKRLQQEVVYTKLALANQGNVFMKNYLHNILVLNVSYEYINKLHEKITQILTFMDEINRSVAKIVSQCS